MSESNKEEARRLKLIQLTVTGLNKPSMTIEFGDKLTIVHGASDTGKSHIFELIHYALGLRKEIEIPPEGKGYQYVHLCVESQDEGVITLVRDFASGQIGLFDGDRREHIDEPASEYLIPNHVTKNPRSISRYILDRISLDAQQVRKNQNNNLRMLELRDVLRLVAVDEEDILSKRSPIEFGQFANRPVEAAIFRLFVQGHDDSGLVEIPKHEELKAASANKVEILDRVIQSLAEELDGVPEEEQLRDQLSKLNVSIAQASASIEAASASRDEKVRQRSKLANQVAEMRERRVEVANLSGRFNLLLAQYDSDLDRLDLLSQAIDVLATDDDESCAFCGARSEHQNWSGEDSTDEDVFLAAVAAEASKIRALHVDLTKTISDLKEEEDVLRVQETTIESEISALAVDIQQWDQDLKVPRPELSQTLSIRSKVERQIDTTQRLHELRSLRDSVSAVEKPKTSTEVRINSKDLNAFDQTATTILRKWGFGKDSIVAYSTLNRDLVVEQRARSSRGKGVRSILHALFNVALAEYCLQHDLRHPGFVILDSPIVTYRQPSEPELTGEDETITTNVVDDFYAYLQEGFSGQSLILENKSPLSPLPEGTKEYFFEGKTAKDGRPGFYPDDS